MSQGEQRTQGLPKRERTPDDQPDMQRAGAEGANDAETLGTGHDLVWRAGRERPPHAAPDELHQEMSGPAGREETTESVGDPDHHEVSSGAQSGAGAGFMAGAAVAGPIGLPIGAAIGAVVGAGAEAADRDTPTNEGNAMRTSGSQGTGPIDPATAYMTPEDEQNR